MYSLLAPLSLRTYHDTCMIMCVGTRGCILITCIHTFIGSYSYTEATDHIALLQGPRSGEKLRCVAATFGTSRRLDTRYVPTPSTQHLLFGRIDTILRSRDSSIFED